MVRTPNLASTSITCLPWLGVVKQAIENEALQNEDPHSRPCCGRSSLYCLHPHWPVLTADCKDYSTL